MFAWGAGEVGLNPTGYRTGRGQGGRSPVPLPAPVPLLPCWFLQGPLLCGWDRSQDDKDTAAKAAIPFSEQMAAEVEEFYFSHYAAHWSQVGGRERRRG